MLKGTGTIKETKIDLAKVIDFIICVKWTA